MKNLLPILLIAFFGITLNLNAQVFEIVENHNEQTGKPDATEIKAYALVKNVSGSTITSFITVEKMELAEGHQFFFCDPVFCYGGSETKIEGTTFDIMSEEFIRNAGVDEKGFYVGLYPNGAEGVTKVNVRIDEVGNPLASVDYDVTFIVVSTGVETTTDVEVRLISSPNPASGYTNIDFGGTLKSEGILTVTDALGNVITQRKVDSGMESVVLDVSGFVPGTYFYRISSNGSITRAAKLAVVR